MCFKNTIKKEISELVYSKNPDDYLDIIENLREKLKLVDENINLLTSTNYVHYASQEISNDWIKSFHLYHDNDIFMFSKLNADRDYTGGFRFELMTDQLKMRLFKKLGNSSQFLSYQSIFIGGEGYTPYIRFTENELNDRNILYEIDNETKFFTQASYDSIQSYMRTNQQLTDRPFASFQYIGRGKYRIHNNGWIRSESLFKIGIVGRDLGKNIQAVIHQDLTTGSQRVLNWEDQIANGGRLAFNIEHKIDVSLFSAGSVLSFNDCMRSKIDSLPINVYIPTEFAFGTVQTHLGTGIGISNKSFFDISGISNPKNSQVKSKNFIQSIYRNLYLSMEYNYRYVVHNSMLESIGFFNAFEDDPLDDEAITIYSLDEESVERNLHKVQFHIGYRVNKVSIYYKHVRFINKEFEVQNIEPTYSEFSTSRWYGFGRIGLNFIL